MEAYCTISYQAATVMLGHMPLDLYLEQYVQLHLVRKGVIVGGNKAEVRRQGATEMTTRMDKFQLGNTDFQYFL